MKRPTETQIAGCMAVLRQFARQSASAAENVQRQAIYSMVSILGGPGVPHETYHEAIKEATQPGDIELKDRTVTRNADGTVDLAVGNILGLPAGRYSLVVGDGEFDPDEDDEDEEDEESDDDGTLPDREALSAMVKDAIEEQAKIEGFNNIKPSELTKDEMIDALLAAREAADDDEDD